jgi:2-polyprenyl-3-methyl-5-hydroxy-6-metoxy-1,4-benzoquinol methylase
MLIRELRALGRAAFLYIPNTESPEVARILGGLGGTFPFSWISGDAEEVRRHTWDWIILDRFKTSPDDYAYWAALGPLIGIDEGGPCRERFDFLLDLLPGPPGASPPNYFLPGLLTLPGKRKESFFSSGGEFSAERPVKILVSFGAEDPQGLTVPAALALLPDNPNENGNVAVTAVFGPRYNQDRGGAEEHRRTLENAGITVMENIPGLGEYLGEFDLVITHFGLTAFEALHGRTPVLLLSPGKYHEQLALRAGFISLGIGKRGIGRIRSVLGLPNPAGLESIGRRCEVLARRYGLDEVPSHTLGALVNDLTPLVPRSCPVCGASPGPVRSRFPDRTYRRCPRCGMIYLLRSVPPPVEYEKDYFFGFYRKQYGKTYLEDFPHLKELGKDRIHLIRRLLRDGKCVRGSGRGLILDIGCAYGPFLAAASEGGFSPVGIDPALDAVRYVKEKLNIPAFRCSFPDPPQGYILGTERFEAVTLWYVTEHFTDPRRALGEIHRLLKPGGVLAFSTPSFRGISGRKSLRDFLEKSPADHWTVWNPGKTGKLLAEAGFELRHIRVTGHHPERFPLLGPILGKSPDRKNGLRRRFLHGLSRVFALGDTFEVYAVKKAHDER